MKTQNLNFSYNWNYKLDCKAFTTIRLSERFEINDHLNVYFNDKLRCHVRVVGKRLFNILELPELICWLDTGYSKAETIEVLRKMYKDVDMTKVKFTVYTLLKVDFSDEKYRALWKTK